MFGIIEVVRIVVCCKDMLLRYVGESVGDSATWQLLVVFIDSSYIVSEPGQVYIPT